MSLESLGGVGDQPLKITGLSGLKTEEIVSALMSIERKPITRMSEEEEVLKDESSALGKVQSALQDLAQSAGELALPTLYTSSQTVSSNEPARVGASLAGQAAIGGYEVAVSQLAGAAQRAFSYSKPESAQTITVNGLEVQLAAGESVAEAAKALNGDAGGSVYASVVGETLFLSARNTGVAGKVEVAAPGGALTEKAGSYREGHNAKYTIDGVEGESESNVLDEAIPGVSLTLSAITPAGSPVTVDVAAPSLSTEKLAAAIKAFVSEYNAALSSLHSELAAKPGTTLKAKAEAGTGMLFGNFELEDLEGSLRQAVYTPVSGLEASMASLEDIGVGTGAPSAHPSQSSIEGQLSIEEAKLSQALQSNPEGVRKLLEKWSASFQKLVEGASGPGGSLQARIQDDEAQTSYTEAQVKTLEEALAVRKHNLEQQYLALETAVQKAHSQSSWLTSQLSAIAGGSSSSG